MNLRSILAAVCLSLPLLLLNVGCGDSGDAVMTDTIATMEEMNQVLTGVKDEASAKAAAPKLEALGTRMKELEKRGNDLKMSPAEREQLAEKYKAQLEKPVQELMQNMMRIAFNPELSKHIEGPMKNMGKVNIDADVN